MKNLWIGLVTFVVTLSLVTGRPAMVMSMEVAQAYCDSVGGELETFQSETIVGCIKWDYSAPEIKGCFVCSRGHGKIHLWWDQNIGHVQIND